MDIKLKRIHKTKNSTIGELSINGVFQCYTLEDVERENKIAGETAISKGTYEIVITYSNRFKQFMPLLLNVPNFNGIRIHRGNKKEHTHGCILVGLTRSEDFIGNSSIAYSNLFSKLKKASKTEKITINIE